MFPVMVDNEVAGPGSAKRFTTVIVEKMPYKLGDTNGSGNVSLLSTIAHGRGLVAMCCLVTR